MGLFDEESQTAWKPIDETPTSGKTSTSIDKYSIGNGTNHWEVNVAEGMWLGADTFSSAPFSVDLAGALTASSVTIKTSTGTVLIDSDSSTANYLEVLNSKMSTISKEILSDFDFGSTDYAGAVKSGDITWNTTTGAITGGSGTVVYRGGIIGAKSGATTFSISSTTGDAVFGGALSAVTGTFGAMTIASGGNIKLGKTAYSDTTNAGFWMGDDSGTTKFHIGASATNLFRYNGTSIEMIGGAITSPTFQTLTTGRRLVITNDQYIRWYNNNDVEAYMRNDSGDFTIDADSTINIVADGSGDFVGLYAGETVYAEGRNFVMSCTNNWQINEADDFTVNYNSDNDGSDCFWYTSGDLKMKLNQSGDLSIDGSYSDGGADYAEYFESLDGKEIPVGTSVILEGSKIREAKKGEEPDGVISANPTMVGNSGGSDSGESWSGKYLRDEFGQFIYEEADFWTIRKNNPKESKGIRKPREAGSGWCDEIKPPKGVKIKKVARRKINPEWNPDLEYIPRKERPEWNIVGLTGQVYIKKGQQIGKRWKFMEKISENVNKYFIK